MEPVPADRFRGAYPHQSCSCARQQLESAVVVLVAHAGRVTLSCLGIQPNGLDVVSYSEGDRLQAKGFALFPRVKQSINRSAPEEK